MLPLIVKIIGSKKYPILPTILLDTVGIEISKILFILSILGLILVLKLIFRGKKKKKTIILDISDAIVNKIKPITAYITPLSIRMGKTITIIISLIICSIMLLVAWGNIFCLPAKYPFKTLEIETNGKVKAMAIKIGPASGSFKRVVAIKL